MTEKRVKLKKINNESLVGAGNISVLTSHQDISGKLDKSQTSYKGKNVVVDSTSGNITFEDKPTIPADVSDLTDSSNTAFTPKSHAHGNLQNNGQVGSTAQANKNVVTNSSGLITTEDKPTIPSASSTTPSADTASGSVGTGTTWARSNHTHPKSSLYAEASHTHSQYLTEHQDISNKIDTAGTGLSKSGTTLNHSNSVTAQTSNVFKKFKYDGQGHITGVSDVASSDLPSHTHTQSQITDFPTIPSASSTVPSADTTSGSYGSGTSYARSNHTHPKSSLYAEASHTHSQYLTSHQDITGKEDISNKISDIYHFTNALSEYPNVGAVQDYVSGELNSFAINNDLGLGSVAFSNDYEDLNNLPQLGDLAYENDVTNYVGPVALSNDYDDLTNKPTHITDLDAQTNMGYKIFDYDENNQEISFADSLVFDGSDVTYNGYTIATLGDIPNVTGKEDKSNKVTSISSSSTDTQYPSAKCVYDEIGDVYDYVEDLDYTQIGGELAVVDAGIQAIGLEQIINQLITKLMGKSDSNHTHSGYASSSHTHGTWSSTSISNGTLYYNSAIRLCSLRYSRTFNSASANTMYEWGQLIPSGYRPKYMVSGSGNRNGATITIDSDGYVYGRFALAFSSSTDFYYHIMWHY